MLSKAPKILVVGSSGKVARFIIDEVIAIFGIEALTISDYKPERLEGLSERLSKEYGTSPNAVVIDITSPESVRSGIVDIEYVIVPVAQKEPMIQTVCIQKGTTCIDLSVSEKLIDESINLHKQAVQGGSLLLMAAGLIPGLSGIMAREVHSKAPNAILDVGLIQAKDGVAGSTGIADMLQLFNQNVDYLVSNGSTKKNGFMFSKEFQFQNRFGMQKLMLANFIERKYLLERIDVRSNYWSAFDDKNFNALIAGLRKIGLLGLFEHPKYRIKLAQFLSRMKKVQQEETIELFCRSEKENGISVLLESDYLTTASCATAYIKLLNDRNEQTHGVFFPFELFEFEEVIRQIDHRIVK